MSTPTPDTITAVQQPSRTAAQADVHTDAWWRWRRGAEQADLYAALLGPHAVARQPRPRAPRR